MKKIIILLSSFVVLGSFLVGCSNSDVTSTKETIVETEAKEIESIELTLENWEEYFELNDKHYVRHYDEFDEYVNTAVGMAIYLKDEYVDCLADTCNIQEIAFQIESDWINTYVLLNEETLEFGETYPSQYSEHRKESIQLFDYRGNEMYSANPILAESYTFCLDYAGTTPTVTEQVNSTTTYVYEELKPAVMYNVVVTNVKGTLEIYK